MRPIIYINTKTKIDMLATTKRFFSSGVKVHPAPQQPKPMVDNWVTDKTAILPPRKIKVIKPPCTREEVRVWDTLSTEDSTATKRKKVTCWVSLFDLFKMRAYYYLRAVDRDGLPIGWYSEKGKKLGKGKGSKWVTNDVTVWMSPINPKSSQAWHQHRVSNGVWEHRVRYGKQWEVVSYTEFYRMAWAARPN
jgi:hypothetical protein